MRKEIRKLTIQSLFLKKIEIGNGFHDLGERFGSGISSQKILTKISIHAGEKTCTEIIELEIELRKMSFIYYEQVKKTFLRYYMYLNNYDYSNNSSRVPAIKYNDLIKTYVKSLKGCIKKLGKIKKFK